MTTETATATDLLARAAGLRPVLEANAAKGEEDRRIAQQSIDALVDAGLFRITVPRRLGGDEVDIATKMRITSTVAEADARCNASGATRTSPGATP
jgi:alkylation response protein AidB-like acyl-CoA dehydrogenase